MSHPYGTLPRMDDDAAQLSPDERALLDFERDCWRHTGQKNTAIRDQLRISPAVYYRQLAALADTDRALAYDRMLVLRIRRKQRRRAS